MRNIAIVYSVVIVFCYSFGVVSGVERNQTGQEKLDSKTLSICVHPYKSSAVLYRSFTPLAEYLAEKIGQPIGLHIAANYEEQIDAVGGENLCIGYMGPASFIKLVDKYGKKRILGRQAINGKPVFHGIIFTRKDSPISKLTDLAGKRFAFGDPESTMSHLVPRYMLIEAGISRQKMALIKFLGNHDNVALSVLTGNFDAGAVKEEVFYKYESRGLKAIATTPALSEHLFVASDALPEALVSKLRQTLLQAHQSEQGLRALHAIKSSISAFVPAEDSDYDNLRTILSSLKSHGIIQ
jgi:phosphonate transport system substrate-binding protein